MKNLFSPFFHKSRQSHRSLIHSSCKIYLEFIWELFLQKQKRYVSLQKMYLYLRCLHAFVICVVIHCFGWLGLAQHAWCQNCFQVPTTLDSREEETWFVNIRPFDKFKCTFIICDHLDSTDNICVDERPNVHELCLSVIRSIISNASTATFSFFYQLMTFTSRPISDKRDFSILNLRLFH